MNIMCRKKKQHSHYSIFTAYLRHTQSSSSAGSILILGGSIFDPGLQSSDSFNILPDIGYSDQDSVTYCHEEVFDINFDK